DRIGEAMLQDPLTGLGNRRRLDLALGDAEPESAVFIDVDDFKAVNDAYSHAVGDEVLRGVAEVLRSASREGDVVVRYGGDEFVILPQGGPDAALAVADRVHRAMSERRWEQISPGLAVTVSIGVGRTNPAHGAMAAADDALIAAKRAGRDRVVHDAL
ncbi:MAG TPA: GGDEF domain-containing protein, partial [Actinotalea sp.]